MRDLLEPATPEDYRFLGQLLTSPVSLSNDGPLKRSIDAYLSARSSGSPQAVALRREADAQIERALRYFGSSDVGHTVRGSVGMEAGVSLDVIVGDVARHLNVDLPSGARLPEEIEALAQRHVERTFASMAPADRQRALEELGVEARQARSFLTQSASVFALPVLIRAFDVVVVQGLVRNLIFGTITRYVGKRVAGTLLGALVARLPWWTRVVGPLSWAFSIGWTALSLQGPAYRKTVPAVLYLGLIGLRSDLDDGVIDRIDGDRLLPASGRDDGAAVAARSGRSARARRPGAGRGGAA